MDLQCDGGAHPRTHRSPTRSLYNLWHELKAEERGSGAWKGKWGTLMHLLLPVGLYDEKGIAYML